MADQVFVELRQSLDGGPWYGITLSGERIQLTEETVFALMADDTLSIEESGQ